MEEILFQIEDLQRASVSIARTYELYQTQSRIQDGPGAQLANGALAVEFHQRSRKETGFDSLMEKYGFVIDSEEGHTVLALRAGV